MASRVVQREEEREAPPLDLARIAVEYNAEDMALLRGDEQRDVRHKFPAALPLLGIGAESK